MLDLNCSCFDTGNYSFMAQIISWHKTETPLRLHGLKTLQGLAKVAVVGFFGD